MQRKKSDAIIRLLMQHHVKLSNMTAMSYIKFCASFELCNYLIINVSKMKWSQHLLAGILIIVFTGCYIDGDLDNPNKVIEGSGPVVTKTLNLKSFHRIENTGVADVYVTLGNSQSVVLKAQQNIIDVLAYEVFNNTLRIGFTDNISIKNTPEIRFDIVIEEISDIGLIGAGYFELSGDFQDDLSISLIGVGQVDAYDLEVGRCTILSSGVGDCKVNVRDELNVTITGVGSIYYKGTPSINPEITGIGKLINDN
jgi:hypothetical protein